MCLNASFIMFFRIFVPNLTLFRTYKVQNLHRLSTRFLFFKVNGCALKVGRGSVPRPPVPNKSSIYSS